MAGRRSGDGRHYRQDRRILEAAQPRARLVPLRRNLQRGVSLLPGEDHSAPARPYVTQLVHAATCVCRNRAAAERRGGGGGGRGGGGGGTGALPTPFLKLVGLAFGDSILVRYKLGKLSDACTVFIYVRYTLSSLIIYIRELCLEDTVFQTFLLPVERWPIAGTEVSKTVIKVDFKMCCPTFWNVTMPANTRRYFSLSWNKKRCYGKHRRIVVDDRLCAGTRRRWQIVTCTL